MNPSTSRDQLNASGPKRRGRDDRDDDESLDEAPRLLEDDEEDVERADLIEENESEEEVENAEENLSSVFDEEPPGRGSPNE
jgi:hypothetical protein